MSATTQDPRGQTVTRTRYPNGIGSPGTAVAYGYAYDHAGNLETVTDAAGNQWQYSYDSLGRQLRADDPDAGDSTATYDDAGQVLTSTLDPAVRHQSSGVTPTTTSGARPPNLSGPARPSNRSTAGSLIPPQTESACRPRLRPTTTTPCSTPKR